MNKSLHHDEMTAALHNKVNVKYMRDSKQYDKRKSFARLKNLSKNITLKKTITLL